MLLSERKGWGRADWALSNKGGSTDSVIQCSVSLWIWVNGKVWHLFIQRIAIKSLLLKSVTFYFYILNRHIFILNISSDLLDSCIVSVFYSSYMYSILVGAYFTWSTAPIQYGGDQPVVLLWCFDSCLLPCSIWCLLYPSWWYLIILFGV